MLKIDKLTVCDAALYPSQPVWASRSGDAALYPSQLGWASASGDAAYLAPRPRPALQCI